MLFRGSILVKQIKKKEEGGSSSRMLSCLNFVNLTTCWLQELFHWGLQLFFKTGPKSGAVWSTDVRELTFVSLFVLAHFCVTKVTFHLKMTTLEKHLFFRRFKKVPNVKKAPKRWPQAPSFFKICQFIFLFSLWIQDEVADKTRTAHKIALMITYHRNPNLILCEWT